MILKVPLRQRVHSNCVQGLGLCILNSAVAAKLFLCVVVDPDEQGSYSYWADVCSTWTVLSMLLERSICAPGLEGFLLHL